MKDDVKSFENIKDLILEFENDFPVNEWKINGIEIWPKLRFKLYIYLCQYILSTEQKILTFDQQKTNNNSSIKFNHWWCDFKEYILLNRQLKNNKLIFFSHSMHRVISNAHFFNRFFDSMIDYHSLQNDSITFEFDRLLKPTYNREKTFDLTSGVRHYRRLKKIKRKIFLSRAPKSTSSLELYDDFFKFCKHQTWFAKELGFDLDSITKWTRKISFDLDFYNKCFLKAKPEKIIFVSYYGFDSTAAAMVAANHLGIETVEFQHGPITDLHMAYSYWTKVPKKGFNTMPLTYWVWDQVTANHFNNWIKPPNRTVVVNQPWLGYSLKLNEFNDAKNFINQQTVLYTLQLLSLSTLEEVFPSSLLEVMKIRSYHFLLRFHPRNKDDKNTYINFLEKNGVDKSKYSFQNPKSVPLLFAMTQVSIHITLWSGSLIEATLINLPTIIFHKIGLMHYQDYIDGELVHYVNPLTRELVEKLDVIISSENRIKLNLPIYNPLN